jgi:hypothetical protein
MERTRVESSSASNISPPRSLEEQQNRGYLLFIEGKNSCMQAFRIGDLNESQVDRVVALVMKNKPSVDLCGYWQPYRDIRPEATS